MHFKLSHFFYFFIVITTTLRCSHVKQMSAYTSAGRLNSHNPLRRICSLNSFNSLQNNCDHAVFCNAGDAAFVSLSSFFIPLHKANNSLVVIKLQRGCCLLWVFFYFFLFSFLFFFLSSCCITPHAHKIISGGEGSYIHVDFQTQGQCRCI